MLHAVWLLRVVNEHEASVDEYSVYAMEMSYTPVADWAIITSHEGGGYAIGRTSLSLSLFVCVSFCLFVSGIIPKAVHEMFMVKAYVTRKKWLNFERDSPNHRLELGRIADSRRDISKEVVDGQLFSAVSLLMFCAIRIVVIWIPDKD